MLEAAQAANGGNALTVSAVPGLNGRMRALLIVFLLVNSPSIVNRIHDYASPDPSFTLALLTCLSAPMQGLGNCIVYGWTPRVRQFYADRCPRLCGKVLGRKALPPSSPRLRAADTPHEVASVVLEGFDSQRASVIGDANSRDSTPDVVSNTRV